jgi:hypothetical protein
MYSDGASVGEATWFSLDEMCSVWLCGDPSIHRIASSKNAETPRRHSARW